MDLFTKITLLAHIVAVLVLITSLPRQLYDIWRERNGRYRKACWLIFLATMCFMLTNAFTLLLPLFYAESTERYFNNLSGLLNAIVTTVLGVAVHVLYRVRVKDKQPKE